jgi:hypothetical protein
MHESSSEGPPDRFVPEDGGTASFRNLVFNYVIDDVQIRRRKVGSDSRYACMVVLLISQSDNCTLPTVK